MPAFRPIDFPPPFDSAEVIGPPTDPEDERIEVGVAIVGGGPAGLACANKLMQLLEDEPELTEKLGEVPVAVIEKGKVPGAHLLSGANVDPSALTRLFPDMDPADWPLGLPGGDQGRDLLPHLEESVPAEAAAAQLPQRGHLHDVGLENGPLPRRESRRGGRLHPLRDRRDQAAGRGPDRQGRALRRPRPRQGRRGARQLRARLRRRRQGDRARRGHDRPPHLRRLRLLRHARGLRPAGLGARGEGDLGGAEAARPGHPHARLAAALGRQVQGGGRQLHLPDGRGQGLLRPRRRPRHHRRHLLGPRRAAALQAAPVHRQDHRGRQAGRLGREDDPLGRLLVAAEALLGARHAGRRRRRRDGQHRRAGRRPLRDARRACTRRKRSSSR